MNWFKKLKNVFTGEKPKVEAEPPPVPIKPGKHIIHWLAHGFRFPARSRVYKKRRRPVRFIDHVPVAMSFRRTRMYDIHREMREANEIRRSRRERQIEATL